MVSRAKQIILSVSIAIVFVLFVGYGINTFYKTPEYENYCNFSQKFDYNSKEYCAEENGRWVEPDIKNTQLVLSCSQKDNSTEYSCVSNNPVSTGGWCEFGERKCDKEFRAVNESYNRNVFIICLILGLSAIIIGGIFLHVDSVGSGLMGGGVLTVIYGTIRYWGQAPDVLRFVILGSVLVILMWIGYTKLNPILSGRNVEQTSMQAPISREASVVSGKAKAKKRKT